MKNVCSVQIALLFVIVSLALPCQAHAGPNSSAGCAVDLDISTRNYTEGISTSDIESSRKQIQAGSMLVFLVVAQNASNLDTVSFDIFFDPEVLEFYDAWEEDAFGNFGAGTISNFLESEGGSTIGFAATETAPGVVNIANALAGYDQGQAPEGSGVLAILAFIVLQDDLCSRVELANAFFMDSDGARSEPTVQDSIKALAGGTVNSRTVYAVANMDNCPADAVCAIGIAQAIEILGECGELNILAGTYEEAIMLERAVTLIIDDDTGPVEIIGNVGN